MPAVVCSHDSLSGIDGGSPSRRQTRVAGLTAGLANRPQRSRQTRGSPHPARHKACTSASGRDRCRGCPSSLVLPRRIARSGCRWCGSERIIAGAGRRVYGNLLTMLPDGIYGAVHARHSGGSGQAQANSQRSVSGAIPCLAPFLDTHTAQLPRHWLRQKCCHLARHIRFTAYHLNDCRCFGR